jgi:hypothetical protein
MTSSYLNILLFLLTTVTYYLGIKPTLTYVIVDNVEEYKKYIKSNYFCLGCYFLLILVVQFIANSYIITQNCGGSITENMGAAGTYTIIPWTLIFGVLIVVISKFPGFKSAFSDVIGYWWVSTEANKLISKLLINRDLEKKLKTPPLSSRLVPSAPPYVASTFSASPPYVAPTPSAPPLPSAVAEPIIEEPERLTKKQFGGAKTEKEQLEDAADLIVKICGNVSLLINQITPSNFDKYWEMLKPLMKPIYRRDTNPESIKLHNDLFSLVVKRDSIGEIMWYLYTGLLVTSLIQLAITTRSCSMNPETMEKNYQAFLEQEQQIKAQQAASTSTTYTITG